MASIQFLQRVWQFRFNLCELGDILQVVDCQQSLGRLIDQLDLAVLSECDHSHADMLNECLQIPVLLFLLRSGTPELIGNL